MTASTLGTILIALALVGTIASIVALAKRHPLTETLWGVTSGAVLGAMLVLLAALLRGDYSLVYVAANTSNALGQVYKATALWAGQEGTNLFWCFVTLMIVGLLLRRRERLPAEDGLLASAAAVLMVMCLGLLALALVKSPFEVHTPAPADGRGLNPLLENPWMVVHPPVLFVGYSLLFVPLALALVSTWRRDQQWLEPARFYTMWGWLFLGAGQMLGAYWAYITLGWGGFWAWDPVENSSLVPWMASTALLHGFIVQRRGGTCGPLNYWLATATAALIIYGAYLTRSGVLADFSVHSFGDLGEAYNNVWLALLALPIVASVVVWAMRRPPVVDKPIHPSVFWLWVGLWVLIGMTILIWLGMSMPLLTQLFGGEGKAVEQSYYNKSQTLMFIVSTVTLLAHLRPRGGATWAALLATGLVATIVLGLLMKPEVALLMRVGLLVCAAVSGALVAAALQFTLAGFRANMPRQAGAGLVHAGVALLVLGALFSVNGERHQRVDLAVNSSAPTNWGELAFGEPSENAQGRLQLPLTLEGREKVSLFFDTPMGLMRHPVIWSHLWGDVYIAPESFSDNSLTSTLTRGEAGTLGTVNVTFEAFEVGSDHGAGGHGSMGGAMRAGARLKVEEGGETGEVTPALELTMDGTKSVPVEWRGKTFELMELDVDHRAVTIRLDDPTQADKGPMLSVQIASKPGIWLVWLGTLVLLAGGLLGLSRPRSVQRETNQPVPASEISV